MLDRNNRGHGSAVPTKSVPNGDSGSSFEVVGFASDEATPTGMREDILLLSWLVLLLRTREDGNISFEWAYDMLGTSNRLSMNEVVKGLEDRIVNVSAAMRQHIKTTAPSERTSTSLILSTSTFSQNSEEVKEEVSEGFLSAERTCSN